MTVQPIALSEADARRLTRGAAMTAPVLFQFMPPLLPSEYQALTESIRTGRRYRISPQAIDAYRL